MKFTDGFWQLRPGVTALYAQEAYEIWQVADTAKSRYAVDSYLDFVSVQAESALRHVATPHPYDDTEGTGTSLRGSTDIVAGELARSTSGATGIVMS